MSCPAGDLAEFRVCTEDAQPLGRVEGVLISPSTRRLEYFVIGSPGFLKRRRYMLPVEAGAVVEDEPKTLRLNARKDELELEPFHPHSVQEFSDTDLLKTIFKTEAA